MYVVERDNGGVEELRRMVRENVGGGVIEQKLWYNLNYGRHTLPLLEGDMNVRTMFKEKDEHEYLHMDENDCPMRYVWEARQQAKDRQTLLLRAYHVPQVREVGKVLPKSVRKEVQNKGESNNWQTIKMYIV